MHSRTWITGELAFAGQLLDNHTENCAIHANETINMIENVIRTHTDLAVERQGSQNLASKQKLGLGAQKPASAEIVSLEKSEIVLHKRGCMSPAPSPAHKKILLDHSPQRRPVPVPGSHTARRAASRNIQPVTKPLLKPHPSKMTRSVSPLRSPRKPLVEVSNMSAKQDAKMDKRSAVKPVSPRKKDRELTGLARLLVPTSASAARVQAIRSQAENYDSPLSRRTDTETGHSLKQSKPAGPRTRVNSAGSVVSFSVQGNLTRKFEEPKAKEPKAKEPKAKEPKAKEPKAKEPKAKEPKAKEPKAKELKTKDPNTKEPKIKEQKFTREIVTKPVPESNRAKRESLKRNPTETKPSQTVVEVNPVQPNSLAGNTRSAPELVPATVQDSATVSAVSQAAGTADKTMPPPSVLMPKLKAPPYTNFGKMQSPMQIQVVGLPPMIQAEATLPDISDTSENSILQEWAYTPEVADRIRRQVNIDPVSVFGPIKPVQMNAIFKRRMRPRTSSAVWDRDGLTSQERLEYNHQMGFEP